MAGAKERQSTTERVISMFADGKFGFMTVETARAHAPLCQKYLTKRCGPQCKALHVRYGQLRPSAGLLNAYNAIMAIKSPMSKPPAVPLNPLLVFSGVLLDSGSSLVIDKHHDCEDAYVFRFAEQHIDMTIQQIAHQGWVDVDICGERKTLHGSGKLGSVYYSLRRKLEVYYFLS